MKVTRKNNKINYIYKNQLRDTQNKNDVKYEIIFIKHGGKSKHLVLLECIGT